MPPASPSTIVTPATGDDGERERHGTQEDEDAERPHDMVPAYYETSPHSIERTCKLTPRSLTALLSNIP